MDARILDALREITPEEQHLLDGAKGIDETIYTSETEEKTYSADKLLEQGKLITVRKHTRFTHFPKHTHDYIEVVYMCQGMTHHVIDGTDVMLHAGELLFMSQNVEQEIYPATENDLAVNFIILPEFFDIGLAMLGNDENQVREFVIDTLKGQNATASYLHFKVADVLPIQNLVENLVWTLWNKEPNKRSVNQATMGLLLMQLINHADLADVGMENPDSKLALQVLNYVESHYKSGELQDLAEELHYNVYGLSREIKRVMGVNYTDLVQKKRLQQAVFLLETTSMSILDVGYAIGYENQSYFHRLFAKNYGMSPRKYRVTHQKQQ